MFNSRMIRAAYTHFSTNLQLFKVIHFIYCTLDSQLDFPPVFYWRSQYHYHSYRVEGWGWAGSHEVVGKGYVFTKNSQMTSIGAIFTPTCHTKQLNPWTNLSANCVVIHSRLSACQGQMGPFEGHSSNLGHQTGLRKRLE